LKRAAIWRPSSRFPPSAGPAVRAGRSTPVS